HRAVLREVVVGLERHGFGAVGLTVSPLRGADGNAEFLLHVRSEATTVGRADIDRLVAEVHA
ncbi:MAG: TlyA family rRNA (cytidine-2'-O)-methyltransferase, partial [Actinomycetes bacterium]